MSKSNDLTKQKCANKDCTSLASKLLCGNCSTVYYCSTKCQKEHWPDHKTQCKLHSSPINSTKNLANVEKAVEKARDPSPTTVSDRSMIAAVTVLINQFRSLMEKKSFKEALDFGRGELLNVAESLKEPARFQVLHQHYKDLYLCCIQLQLVADADKYCDLSVELAESYFKMNLTIKPFDPHFILVEAKLMKCQNFVIGKKAEAALKTAEDALLTAAEVQDKTVKNSMMIRLLRLQAICFFQMRKIDQLEHIIFDRVFEILSQGEYYTSSKEFITYVQGFAENFANLRLVHLVEKVYSLSYKLMKKHRASTAATPNKDVDFTTAHETFKLGFAIFQLGRKKESYTYFQECIDLRKPHILPGAVDEPTENCLKFMANPVEESSTSNELENRFSTYLKMENFKGAYELAVGDLLTFYKSKSEPARSFYCCTLYPFIIDVSYQNKKEADVNKYLEMLLTAADQYYKLTADCKTSEDYAKIIPNRPFEICNRNDVLAVAKLAKCKQLQAEAGKLIGQRLSQNAANANAQGESSSRFDFDSKTSSLFEQAEVFGKEALRLMLISNKPDLPRMFQPYSLLGFVQGHLKKFSESDVNYSLAYDIMVKGGKEVSEECINMLMQCQNLFDKVSTPEVRSKYEKFSRRLYDSLKKISKSFDSKTVPAGINPEFHAAELKKVQSLFEMSIEKLAVVLVQKSNVVEIQESISLYKECLVVREKNYGSTHRNIGIGNFQLAEALCRCEKYDEAIPAFQKAQQIIMHNEDEKIEGMFHRCIMMLNMIKLKNPKLKVNAVSRTVAPVDDSDENDFLKLEKQCDSFISSNDFNRALLRCEKSLNVLEPIDKPAPPENFEQAARKRLKWKFKLLKIKAGADLQFSIDHALEKFKGGGDFTSSKSTTANILNFREDIDIERHNKLKTANLSEILDKSDYDW